MIRDVLVNAIATLSFSILVLQDFGYESRSELALWKIIDGIESAAPLSKYNFENALGTTTFLLTKDEHESTWRGGPVVLSSDLGIVAPEITLDPSDRFTDSSSASFDVVGKCITVEQVTAHFRTLAVVDTPRGHSYLDETVYRSRQRWGDYYFSFRQIARDCLSSVSIDSHKEPELPPIKREKSEETPNRTMEVIAIAPAELGRTSSAQEGASDACRSWTLNASQVECDFVFATGDARSAPMRPWNIDEP